MNRTICLRKGDFYVQKGFDEIERPVNAKHLGCLWKPKRLGNLSFPKFEIAIELTKTMKI